MKLHLPKPLFLAVMACLSAFTAAHADTITFAITSSIKFDGGSFTTSNGSSASWKYFCSGQAGYGSGHTLKLTGTGKDLAIDFTPFSLNALIVEQGATGYVLTPNANSRDVVFGRTNESFNSEIHESFTLKAGSAANFTIQGTQSWSIDSGKTFTIGGPSVITNNADLTVTGGGMLDVSSSSIGGGGTVTVSAGTTLKLGTATNAGAIVMNSGSVLDVTAITISAETPFLINTSNMTLQEGSYVRVAPVNVGGTVAVFDKSIDGVEIIFTDAAGNVAGYASRSDVSVEDGVYTVNSLVVNYADMVWAGGDSGIWDTSTKNWQSASSGKTENINFYNGDSVTFNSSATVTVAEGISVKNLTLGENVRLQTTGALAVAGDIVSNNGSSWVLDGDFTQQLSDSNVKKLKSIVINEGVVLDVTTTGLAGFNPENISGSGTVEVSLTGEHGNILNIGSSFTGETYVRQGYFTLSNAKVGNTLRLGNGVEGQTTLTSGTQFAANIILEGTSAVHANGSKAIVYNGTLTGTNGVFLSKGSSSHTFNGTVTLAGFNTENSADVTFNEAITLGYLTVDYSGVDATANKDATITGTLTVSNNVNVNFASSAQIGSVAHNGGNLTFSGEDVSVTVDGKLYAKRGTLNIGSIDGGSVIVTAEKLEAGDSDNSNNLTLNIFEGATLKIVGTTDNSDYKTTSLLISEWIGGTTLNVDGKLLAENASLLLGDSRDASYNPYDTIVNVGATGTLAVKGIKNSKGGEKYGTLKLTISDGGKLILGENGFSTPKNVEANIGHGTIGISADNVTIEENLNLTSADGAIFDTQKYNFATDGNSLTQTETGGNLTVSGVLSGEGGVVKAGAGNLIFTCDHTYTNTTDIQAGSLVLNLGSNGVYTLDGAVTGAGTLEVKNGTQLLTDGYTVSTALYLNNGSLLSAVGTVEALGGVTPVADSATVFLAEGANHQITGNFSTQGALSVVGNGGSLALAGATNTFGGSITVAGNNTLTLSGALAFTDINESDYYATYAYDENCTHIQEKTNGLGSGLVTLSGLFNGSIDMEGVTGTTVNGASATINEAGDVTYTNDKAIYYVMDSVKELVPEDPTTQRGYGVYSLANGTEVRVDSVIHVGVHDFTGPVANDDANHAKGFYVDAGGVLAIMGDSHEMLGSDILESVQGSGDIYILSPGYKTGTVDTLANTITFEVDSKTKATGALYLSPYELTGDAYTRPQVGVFLRLVDDADITSFSSVHYGYPQSQIIVDGYIGADAETGTHINDLSAVGCGIVFLCIDKGANNEIVLGGTTTIAAYKHGTMDLHSGILDVDFHHENSLITIEQLSGKKYKGEDDYDYSALKITTGMNDNYDGEDVSKIKGVVDIKSFDYEGFVTMLPMEKNDTLHLNINLEDSQVLRDGQVCIIKIEPNLGKASEGTATFTIKGSGTYVLGQGNSMDWSSSTMYLEEYNFGVLDAKWTGTVQVNNLDASGKNVNINGINPADYGNADSTVDFIGFKGYLNNANLGDADMNVLFDMVLTNTSSMKGFELTNESSGNALVFEGNIRGTGDFVVSMGDAEGDKKNETIHFKGDLSGWAPVENGSTALIVEAGEQTIQFTDKATAINADLLTTGGTMNATIRNDAAVTVNGAVSHEAGGTLNMTVNTAKGTTFNNTVDINKLVVSSGSIANVAAGASVGEVGIQSRADGAAVLQNGMTIAGSSVTGGSAQNAALTFQTDGSVSSATLTDSSLASLKKAASINLSGITAKNVYLAGEANFVSLDDQANFQYKETIVAYERQYNEVSFSTSSYSGMILDAQMVGDLTLTVTNGIEGWDDAMADAMTNVTIKLDGFRVEGMENGERVDKWFEPLHILLSDSAASVDVELAMTVNQLLDVNSYAYVFYEQQADGLVIRMSNIPEPSTATLSLLALAALAARRRRK